MYNIILFYSCYLIGKLLKYKYECKVVNTVHDVFDHYREEKSV